MTTDPLDAPALARFADLTVQVAPPIEVGPVGHGQRRVIPILGGSCVGRDWSARVLPGGADFLRVGGKDLDGALMTVAPVLVAEQLPDSNPVKAPGVDYVKRYEAKHGAGSRSLFGATAWDAQLWLNAAIPVALKKVQPGTEAFRLGLRDAIEVLKEFVGSQGVFNLSATDHNGVDERSQVMVKVEGGAWKLVK